jgi:5'-3' exonuclease
MEQRKPFKRVTIPEKKHEPVIEPSMLDAQMALIDEEVDRAMVELLNELGYEASENMTLEQYEQLAKRMENDGIYVSIHTETNKMNYDVKLQVLQVAKTLRFTLAE